MFKNKEYILTVYREGGFTRAAEKMFISQPSLSASVKRIEERIGAPIFDRSTSPITLTDIGKEYVRCALDIEERERGFARYIEDTGELLAGQIRIGGTSFFSSFVLPRLISEFREQHEAIRFEIYEDSTKHLLEKLNTGDLDLVIDNAFVTDGEILSEVYLTERLLLAVPRRIAVNEALSDYAMTAEDIKSGSPDSLDRAAVDLGAFAAESFILLHHENDTGRRAEELFRAAKITPKVIFRLDQQVTAYNMSASGMGISFVSDTLVRHIGASEDLIYYNLPSPFSERSIYIYRKRNRYQPLCCRKFVEFCAIL